MSSLFDIIISPFTAAKKPFQLLFDLLVALSLLFSWHVQKRLWKKQIIIDLVSFLETIFICTECNIHTYVYC